MLYANLKEAFQRIEFGLIVVHAFPDFDAIGSAIGLHLQLANQGISTDIWIPDHLNSQYQVLPSIDVISKKIPKKSYDTLLVLDCSSLDRVKDAYCLDPIIEQKNCQVINIDHHPDNQGFGDIQCVQTISSVGELLVHIFNDLKWEINKDIATCLYAAMVYDTGRFAYTNVTSDTLCHAGMLVKKGANPYKIYEALYETKSKESYDLLKIALDRLVFIDDIYTVYTTIPFTAPRAHFKIIDFIRESKMPQIALVFQEVKKGEIKVNIRSKNTFDVSAFSQLFGGGGHKKASGFIKKGDLMEVCHEVIDVLRSHLE